LINYFFDFRFMDPLRSYSRSKSIVVKNLAKFSTIFFAVTNFGVAGIVPILSPLLRGTSTEKKSRKDIPTSPEVIASNTLNFRPDF